MPEERESAREEKERKGDRARKEGTAGGREGARPWVGGRESEGGREGRSKIKLKITRKRKSTSKSGWVP